MPFICYIPFNIYPWLLLPSLGSRRRNLRKTHHLHNLPTSWTKLVTHGKHFLGYGWPLRMSFEELFYSGYSECNQTIKRWKKYTIHERKMFHFRLQQFETNDVFFKRINQVSSLTAQIKRLHDLNLEGLLSKNLVRIFPYSWVLINYGSADHVNSGTHIFFCKRRAMR